MEKQFLLLFLTAIIFFVSLLGRFFFLKMRTYLINKNPNKKTYRIKEHDKKSVRYFYGVFYQKAYLTL